MLRAIGSSVRPNGPPRQVEGSGSRCFYSHAVPTHKLLLVLQCGHAISDNAGPICLRATLPQNSGCLRRNNKLLHRTTDCRKLSSPAKFRGGPATNATIGN